MIIDPIMGQLIENDEGIGAAPSLALINLLNQLRQAGIWVGRYGTTAQRPTLPDGLTLSLLYYNTDTPGFEYVSSLSPLTWTPLAGGGGGGTVTSVTATAPIVATPSPIVGVGVISHQNSGVAAATYGDATHIPQIQFNATGHAIAAANILITLLTSPLSVKGQIWGFSTVDVAIPAPAGDGLVLTSDSLAAAGASWQPDTAANRWSWVFGSGIDGAAVADGVTAIPGMTLAGTTYTCTRSHSFTDFTVNAGIRVLTANMGPMRINGTLTLNGTIDNSGAPGVGGASGVQNGGGFYGNTSSGGSPGASPANALGGAGGQGGLTGGGGGIGGGTAGGTVTIPTFQNQGLSYAGTLFAAEQGVSGTGNVYQGGAGGTAGGVGNGGGGGAGGQCICVLARVITGAGTGKLESKGGNGAGGTAGNGGGGGGGGGGCVWFATTTVGWSAFVTISVAGGTGGAPFGTGNFGVAGSTGRQFTFVLA